METSLLELPLPLRIVPSAPVSDDALIAFSRANKGLRIEKNSKGEIVVMTPAGRRGDWREKELAVALDSWAQADGRGEANGANAGWNLSDGSTLSPDASWTASERLARFSDEEQERFLPICPDFVAEIRSRSDSITDLQEKMERWIANGARLAWLIDPFTRTAYIYQPGRPAEALHAPAVLEGEGPLAGFRLEMARFWA